MASSKHKTHGPEVQVACHVCRREVPLSRALSADVRDYVVFFCTQTCFDKWREDMKKLQQDADNNDR